METIVVSLSGKITLCAVVYNEAERIADFIEYHQEYFDNIVILDQLSTDATPSIIRRYPNVKLCYDQNRSLAEPSRHIAALNSDTEWILFLDADEFASPWLLDNLLDLMSDKWDGYVLNRQNLLDGVEFSQECNQYRLFKRNAAFLGFRLHEGIQTIVHKKVKSLSEICIIHNKPTQERDEIDYAYRNFMKKNPELVNKQWEFHYRVCNTDISELLTLCINTSPRWTNPSIDHIVRLIDTYNKHLGTGPCPKIIVADGYNPEYNLYNQTYNKIGIADKKLYEIYKNNLSSYCRKNRISFVELDEHVHRNGSCIEISKRVGTPYQLLTPHDFVAVQDFPTRDILNGMSLYRKIKKLMIHTGNLKTDPNWNTTLRQDLDAPFCCYQTNHWSNNPSIAYSDWYRSDVVPKMKEIGKFPIELVMDKEYKEYISKHGLSAGVREYGQYIYGEYGCRPWLQHDFSYYDLITDKKV